MSDRSGRVMVTKSSSTDDERVEVCTQTFDPTNPNHSTAQLYAEIYGDGTTAYSTDGFGYTYVTTPDNTKGSAS